MDAPAGFPLKRIGKMKGRIVWLSDRRIEGRPAEFRDPPRRFTPIIRPGEDPAVDRLLPVRCAPVSEHVGLSSKHHEIIGGRTRGIEIAHAKNPILLCGKLSILRRPDDRLSFVRDLEPYSSQTCTCHSKILGSASCVTVTTIVELLRSQSAE